MASAREVCACGAGLHVKGDLKTALRALQGWRKAHRCPAPAPEPEGEPFITATGADIQLAADYTVPELHIGFRPNYYDED